MKNIAIIVGFLISMLAISAASAISIDGNLIVQGGNTFGFVDLSGTNTCHEGTFIGDNYVFENFIDSEGEVVGNQAFFSMDGGLNFDQGLIIDGSLSIAQDLVHWIGEIESTTKQETSISNGIAATSQSVIVGETSSAASLGVAAIADFVQVNTEIGAVDDGDLVYESGHCVSMGASDSEYPMLAAITSASGFNANPIMGQTSMAATGKYASSAEFSSRDRTPDLLLIDTVNWQGTELEVMVALNSDNLVRTAIIRIENPKPAP